MPRGGLGVVSVAGTGAVVAIWSFLSLWERRPRRRRECRPRPAAAPGCRRSSRSRRSCPCAPRTSTRRGPSAPSSPRRTPTRRAPRRGVADRPLLGRAPVRVDGVDVGDDQQRVGPDLDRQQGARQVLVDHRLDAAQPAAGRRGVVACRWSGCRRRRRRSRCTPCSSSARITWMPKIRFGAGEGTARRMLSPSGMNAQPFSLLQAGRLGGVVDRADRLGRPLEGRIGAVDLDHGQQRRQMALERQLVAELLLEHVADHPLGLRAQDVERIGVDRCVGRALERQQADLRAVAVRRSRARARARAAPAPRTPCGRSRAGSRPTAPGRGAAGRCLRGRRRRASFSSRAWRP